MRVASQTGDAAHWRAGAGLAVLVAACLAPLLAACGDARTTASQTFTPAHAGVLTVAATLPAPGSWVLDDDGRPVGGFEYELAVALADRFDLRLEVIDVPFERIVAGDLGGADLALAEISATDARASVLDFSEPYYRADAGVLAATGEEVLDLKTARERSWGTLAGTTDAAFVADVIRPEASQSYPDEQACARAVAAGTIDACLMDLPTALAIEQEVAGVDTVARFATDEPWAIAFAEGVARTNVEVVDAGIRALTADGSLGRFVDEWLLGGDADGVRAIPIIEART